MLHTVGTAAYTDALRNVGHREGEARDSHAWALLSRQAGQCMCLQLLPITVSSLLIRFQRLPHFTSSW